MKIWSIPETKSLSALNPISTLSDFQKRPEVLLHNPIAADLFAVAVGNHVNVWNADKEIKLLGNASTILMILIYCLMEQLFEIFI